MSVGVLGALSVSKPMALWIAKCGLVAASLAIGGALLYGAPAMVEAFGRLGLPRWLRPLVGGLEIIGALALPSLGLAPFGALLLACLAFGAVLARSLTLDGAPVAELAILLLAATIVWFDRGRLGASLDVIAGGQSHERNPIPRAILPPLPALAAVLAVVCAGCATPPADPAARAEFDETNDPLEPTNREIFGANQFIDRNALKPAAQAYQDWIPEGMRTGIHNLLGNLKEPQVLLNDVLQANPGQAWTTLQRFTVNTTVGGLGVFDVAADWDLPRHQADFGQTLGVWGVAEGPFIELPLLGPSNVRDTVGNVAGMLTNPLSFVPGGVAVTAVQASTGALGALDQRSRNIKTLDDLEHDSLDFYAALRTIQHQRRDALIEQGKAPGSPKGRIDVSFPGRDAPKP
jgi:phospholipid-binding lipoprotein MlaA